MSVAPLSRPAGRIPRRVLSVVLLAGLLMTVTSGTHLQTALPQAAAASNPVHVKVQGHIVSLTRDQITVRDARLVVHTVLLNSATTYWHKLDQLAFNALKQGMRVYVLGTPNHNGTVTALKIHIYYPVVPKKKAATT